MNFLNMPVKEFDIFVSREEWNRIKHVTTMESFLLCAVKRFHDLELELFGDDDVDLPKSHELVWAKLYDLFKNKLADLSMFFRETEDFNLQTREERKRLIDLADSLVDIGRYPKKMITLSLL